MSEYTKGDWTNPNISGEAFESMDIVETATKEAACSLLTFKVPVMLLSLAPRKDIYGDIIVVFFLA